MNAIEQTQAPHSGFVVVNGLRLHYLDFGGDGRPVVLLHGVTSHGSVWRDLAPHIANRRLIALDSRGHGDSQWSVDHRYATEDLASDVVAFIGIMDLGVVDVVGGSWGGLVGLNAALRMPGLIEHLAMVDIPPSFPGPPSEVQTDPYSYLTHAEVVAYVRDGSQFIAEATAEVVAAFGVRPGEKGQLYAKHDEYFQENRPHRSVDYWDDLESLRIPLLIARADDSTHLSLSVAERMLKVAHDAELVSIPDTGHRISTDNPEALGTALESFLIK